MPKSDFVNANDVLFNEQLQTFNQGLATYTGLFGLTPAQILSTSNDAASFNYTLQCLTLTAQSAQQWTAWKNLARRGGSVPPSGAPIVPEYPASVAAVEPGIEGRFRALVKLIKANPNYNTGIGEMLGIEGTQQTGPDLTTLQPVIEAVLTGNQVQVKWGWGGNRAWLDLCELQVDRGDGQGYKLLAYDTTPNYTDTQPLPAAPAVWTYRAIYRVGDAQVGVWSNPVSVTVGG